MNIPPDARTLCDHCGHATTGGRFCIHCGGAMTQPGAERDQRETREIPVVPEVPLTPTGSPLPHMTDVPWDENADLDARIGTIVAGRYRIDAVLGQGGFGSVYRGTHLEIGEPVAIKFLHAELASMPELRARFRREAVALARLRHPGIVAVHDFGDEGGTLYLIMEMVAGVGLDKRVLTDGKTMPVARVAAIFDQILQVLEAAHAAGIVHRDMKPENVLLLQSGDRTEHVKVLDFGIAYVDDQEGKQRLTATGIVQGTPIYMSPEQCRGRDIGPKTDIYAAGVMLYELLAGEPPFLGESSTDLMVKHMFIEPPPILDKLAVRGASVPDQPVPPSLEALARWALAKKPDDRPTAAEMRDALGRAMAGTDAVTRGEKSTAQRLAAVHLTREERGFAPAAPRDSASAPIPAVTSVADGPRVLLWALDTKRAEGLTSSLAVHGMRGVVWTGAGDPPATLDGAALQSIILPGDDKAAERTARLKAASATARLPVLVVDLIKPEDTPVMIRAGASDVTLALVGDEAICKKLKRLIQRGR